MRRCRCDRNDNSRGIREVALTHAEYDQIVELLGREPSAGRTRHVRRDVERTLRLQELTPLLKHFPTTGERVLQGPGENAGAVDIGDGLAVVFKIESHNHPRAVEPYQGAATGVGGIVRDIFTMGARPIAVLELLPVRPTQTASAISTSSVASSAASADTATASAFRRSAAISSSMKSTTAIPSSTPCASESSQHDKMMRAKASGVGNLVVLVGADTGRDGIHGATFASVDNPEESHRGVVQVGNPFLEKLLLEACLEALEVEDVVAMQDLGAAGLTSSIVECASKGEVGIEIDVQHVSRRESGMTAYEVMLSESQERMLIIVTEAALPELRAIFERWDLHSDVIGKVTDDGRVRILDGDTVAADVPASLYTDECPVYVREGIESPSIISARTRDLSSIPDLAADDVLPVLHELLASPNICSREPVIRTYDHTIMSNTVIPPMDGDAAVVRIKGTNKALSVKTDCNPRYVYLDPYLGGQHAVAEAARNVSCTGAEPLALTNCLNFGSPEKPEGYFQLQQAVLGMAKAAEALGTPVVSGNVSLYNESGSEAILPTPTVGMVGLLHDVNRRAGLAPAAGSVLLLVGQQTATLGATEYLAVRHDLVAGSPPDLNLTIEHNVQSLVRSAIAAGLVNAAHDTSEGGLLVAIAEMLIAADTGASIALDPLLATNDSRYDRTCFGEAASRIIIAVAEPHVEDIKLRASDLDIDLVRLGTVTSSDSLSVDIAGEVTVAELRETWESGLKVGR